MAKKKRRKKIIMYRSAKTGRAVTKAHAKRHPATTERETYRRRKRRKKSR